MARFWALVGKADPDSCWEWQGKRDRDGYGVFRIQGKDHRAHRIAYGYYQFVDPPPVVMHSCDNPACCNPQHLSGGSQVENILDKTTRNRQAKGVRNGRAKLSELQVMRIKLILDNGLMSKAA